MRGERGRTEAKLNEGEREKEENLEQKAFQVSHKTRTFVTSRTTGTSSFASTNLSLKQCLRLIEDERI